MPGERLVETVDQFRGDNERFERGQRQITSGINEIQNGDWNDGAQHVLQGIRNEAWYGAKTFLNIDIDNANVRAILAGTLPTLIIDQGGRENPNGRWVKNIFGMWHSCHTGVTNAQQCRRYCECMTGLRPKNPPVATFTDFDTRKTH